MKKPEKPKIEKISGIFRRLFARKQNQLYPHLKENARWSAKPTAAVSTPDQPVVDPAARFRILTTSRGVTTTPLQYIPPAPTAQQETDPQESAKEAPIFQPGREKLPPVKSQPARKPLFEPTRAMPAFWTIASALSLLVNIILILALVLLGREFFVLKGLVGEKLLGGLYENFIYMDQAHIKTTINVADDIPISFNLPISQDIVVVLTQNTTINGANVRINTGSLIINSPANIVLPAGTSLPVHLELNVPVTTSVPITIEVPVDIPLEQTELHKPFIGLQQVVSPFYNLMQPQIKGPQDTLICKPFSVFCSFFFRE